MPNNSFKNTLLRLPIAQKIAFAVAILSLLTAAIIITTNFWGERQLIQQSSELFGNSLIQQLANEASNPLVQNDHLSLQSLLKELVASPIVLGAVIYDIENNAAAEAGEIRRGRSISASITFQDSIAGYVVITIDTTPLQQKINRNTQQLIALAILLAMLCYVFSLIIARYMSSALNDLRVIAATTPSKRHNNSGIAYQGDDEIQQLAQQIINGPNPYHSEQAEVTTKHSEQAILILTTKVNNQTQTLNSESSKDLNHFTASLVHAQKQLKTICKLYDGDIQINRSGGLCISFRAKSEGDNFLFRALCTGLLSINYLAQQNISQLSASLVTQPEAISYHSFEGKFEHLLEQQRLIDHAFELANVGQHLVMDRSLYYHHAIKDKVKIKSQEHHNMVVVEALQEPYNALLQQQLSNLTS
jgi:uncharacterized membrane protein affecting hemolysin expression